MKNQIKEIKSFDGATIHYEVIRLDNQKPCLFFLHGLTGNLTAWKEERKFFEDLGISSIAMDLRGHGKSGRSNDLAFYKMENFVKDVLSVIKNEKFEKYVIVGHCFGGMVSILLESKYPKTGECLVLVDTSYKPPAFEEPIKKNIFFEYIFNLMTKNIPSMVLKGYVNYDDYVGTGDLNMRRIGHDILHTSLKTFLAISGELQEYDASKLLGKIEIPTLIIEGEKDIIFPPPIAEYLQKRIKGSYLEIMPGENHVVVINNPMDLSREIYGFLEALKCLN